MPAPRGFTNTMASVAQYADQALTLSEGITITWRADQFGLEQCASKSRGFQTTFSSLRAKERRRKIVHVGGESVHALDQYTRGKYCNLACSRYPLADNAGWCVTLAVGTTLMDGVEVVNNATGELMSEFDPQQVEFERLLMKCQKFPAQVTQAEYDFILSRDPDIFKWEEAKDGVWFRLASGQREEASPPASVDLTELPRGALFGRKEVEGENNLTEGVDKGVEEGES